MQIKKKKKIKIKIPPSTELCFVHHPVIWTQKFSLCLLVARLEQTHLHIPFNDAGHRQLPTWLKLNQSIFKNNETQKCRNGCFGVLTNCDKSIKKYLIQDEIILIFLSLSTSWFCFSFHRFIYVNLPKKQKQISLHICVSLFLKIDWFSLSHMPI